MCDDGSTSPISFQEGWAEETGKAGSDSIESENSALTCGQYVKCGVPSCNNYFDGQRQEFIGISYFSFPEDPEIRKQWIKAIDLPENTDTSALTICSHHFGYNDIYNLEEVDGKTTAHLKPNAYPCKKLYAFVEDHETYANDLLTTDKDVLPKITSVLSMDMNAIMARSTETLGSSETRSCRRNAKADQLVEEMSNNAEELIGEEVVSFDDGVDSHMPVPNPEKGLQVIPALVKLPPRFPKVDLVGDSINADGDASSGPITTSRLPNVDLANELSVGNDDESVMDQISEEPSTSSIIITAEGRHVPTKRRRARASKEEIRRREEEDEWEPSFWSKRALEKAGFANSLIADKKRKENEIRNRTARTQDFSMDLQWTNPNKPDKNQDDGLEEEDEGWRVVEPIATGDKEKSDAESEDGSSLPLTLLEVSMTDGTSDGTKSVPPPRKRRPGPASKTCRPRYIPEPNGDELDDAARDDVEKKPSSEDEGGHQLNLSEDSLLMDWSFFKSLLPDLGKMTQEKRIELKSFVLDTLNSAIYDGKPITPILNL